MDRAVVHRYGQFVGVTPLYTKTEFRAFCLLRAFPLIFGDLRKFCRKCKTPYWIWIAEWISLKTKTAIGQMYV
jgi:hypothetical protein